MDVSEATSNYAEYLSGLPFAQEFFDKEALAEYEADLAKARAEMERAWLESNPTLESHTDPPGK